MTSLNASQQRSILLGVLDIHRRMVEMEALIVQGTTSSPLSRYVNDLSPTEARVIQDYFARIRTTMLACLQELGIPLEVEQTSLRWAVQVGIIFLNVAVADMGPGRLAGYGPVDPAGAADAVRLQDNLNRLIDRAKAYLHQGLGRDLPQRLARLDAAPASVEMLTLLDRVITRWHLVEFRPLLDAIVRRLEAPQFEIAVFGRVSSGKSSLLNHIAGMDVLPVGVTPITAVPSRLVRGAARAAVISFAELPPRTIDVTELRAYASEEGNPGNRKHVTGILVQLPAPRLREGVVFVDTPGIGSLAHAGSDETFAYLPRCDLGVVLIDAASTLNEEDLTLVRILTEGGIPSQVLLSKADLLTPADRQRMAEYLHEQLRRELGLDLPVHPVSTVGADEAHLTGWFEHEIEPLLDRQRSLVEASLRRKIAHLHESVVAVLQTLQARPQGGGRGGPPEADVRATRRLLEEADEVVRQTRERARDWTWDEPALVDIILQDAARAIVAPAPDKASGEEGPILRVVREVLSQRARMAYDLVTGLQHTLSNTLEALRQSAPMAPADVGAIRDLALSGLPAVDLSLLREDQRRHRPWWASLLPSAAVWATRRGLRKRLGPVLSDQVEVYDRQIQAWLKSGIAQLVDLFESQAEVFREQVRRLTANVDSAGASGDQRELVADLQELQQPGAAGQAPGMPSDSAPAQSEGTGEKVSLT
jgi:GTP-binding protein EngB required for normal cell division